MEARNSTLLTSGYDGYIRIWDVPLKSDSILFTTYHDPITSLCYHVHTIFAGTLASRVHSIDLSTAEKKEDKSQTLDLIDKIITDIQGKSVFISGQNYHAEEYNTTNLCHTSTLLGPIDDDLVDICISNTRDSLFMATASGSVIERDLTTREIKNRFITIPPITGLINNGGTASMTFDDTNGYLLTGGYSIGQARAFKGEKLSLFRIWELPNSVHQRSPITCITALPEQNSMIYGDANGYLCFSTYDSDMIKKYWNSQHDTITCLKALNSKMLLVGYRNGSIELYNRKTWELLSSANAHKGPVTGAVYLPQFTLSQNLVLPLEPTMVPDLRAPQETCISCDKQIETYFWFCPECTERVFRSRCQNCRRKERSEYAGRMKCNSCGFNPSYDHRGY